MSEDGDKYIDKHFGKNNSDELEKLPIDDAISKNLQLGKINVINNVNAERQPEVNYLASQNQSENEKSLIKTNPEMERLEVVAESQDDENSTDKQIEHDENSKNILIEESTDPLSPSNIDILEPEQHKAMQSKNESLSLETTSKQDNQVKIKTYNLWEEHFNIEKYIF